MLCMKFRGVVVVRAWKTIFHDGGRLTDFSESMEYEYSSKQEAQAHSTSECTRPLKAEDKIKVAEYGALITK